MNRVKEIKRVVQLGKPNDILKRWCKANEKGEFELQGQLNLSDVIYLLSANERLRDTQRRMQIIIDAFGKSTIILDNRIMRLKKEKKWLECKVLEASQKQYPELSYAEKVAMLEDDMQQALKEK